MINEIYFKYNALLCKIFTQTDGKKSKFGLTPKTKLNYISSAFTKSNAGHCKIVLIYKANSTPERAFFVRSVYAPIKNSLFSDKLFSMVAHSGKGFALCRFPCMTVLQPVMCYRPRLQTFAVVPKNLYKETTQMKQFIFAAIRRTDLSNRIQKIRINAETERDARAQCAREFILVLAGKINLKNTLKNDRTFAAHSSLFALPTQGGAQ